jgi:hypothetical protein
VIGGEVGAADLVDAARKLDAHRRPTPIGGHATAWP